MFNFGFGDSVAVNAALFDVFGYKSFTLDDFHPNYPPVEGDARLTELTSLLIKRMTGKQYRHVLLTHGATGAINTLMRTMGERGGGVYHDELHFLYYPQMVRRLGMLPVERADFFRYEQVIHLTASPSNPTGDIHSFGHSERTIWDGVYHNDVYTDLFIAPPLHKAMVGSYSKYLGLNGARVGWIATDDKALYEKCVHDALFETLGVSTLGTALVTQILTEGEKDEPGIALDKLTWFEMTARGYLNDNRTELQRLEYLFNRQVPTRGMFYFSEADDAARELLAKAGVKYIDGQRCGGSKGSVRLTLGQDRDLTRAMVRAVLKEDGK
jgi:aspartate/methionine/tyrosine aminotransferase